MSESPSAGSWQKELAVAHSAADRASEILLSYFGNLSQVSEKEQAGLVSEADQESEKAIREILLREFPEHQFLGEESGLSTGKNLHGPADPKTGSAWIVDPLDGTTNYVYRFPIFCISIALQVDGELVVAVVDAPILKERYYAVKGEGAFLNEKPISTSKREKLSESLLATGFSVSRPELLDDQIKLMNRFLHSTRGLRRPGAAAYDLCLVAAGIFDGFWENNLNAWDTAAGTLLVREAGGVVSNYSGEKYLPEMSDIVAASTSVHGEMLAEISSVTN